MIQICADLGDEVECKLSGYKGLVVSSHKYINGCTRLTVQSKSKKGDPPKLHTFDEPDLKILKKKKSVKRVIDKVIGGPEKYSDVREH